MKNKDFQSSGKLAKELGLLEVLTIGIGTMIGAGIFILPRYAIDLAGPGAIFAYIFAGLVCAITAASTKELATGMLKERRSLFFYLTLLRPTMGNYLWPLLSG